MGFLRDSVHNHHMKDPVRGQALVVDINDWLMQNRTPYSLQATLVVTADGMSKVTVQHAEMVNNTSSKLERWPDQGATIPVTIDRADPTRLQIEWDDVPSQRDVQGAAARQQAEARKQELIAQAYHGEGPLGAPAPEAGGAHLDPELQALMDQEEAERKSGA
jgi:hypothetical protein